MSFLRVDGLSKSFGGRKSIQKVDFAIEEGESRCPPISDCVYFLPCWEIDFFDLAVIDLAMSAKEA
jgi:hypothetical protein